MKQAGYSLVELLLAAAIGLIVLGGAGFLMVELGRSQTMMQTNLANMIDISALRLKLGREVGGAQMRTFVFTGNAEIQSSDVCSACSNGDDRPLARFIVPLANKCRDLSKCDGDITLLFSSQRHRRAKPVEAVCFINSDRLLLMEDLPVGDLISLVGPPNSTIWRTEGVAEPMTVDSASGAPLPPECINTLLQLHGKIPTSQLYSLKVRPVIGETFTNGSCVCESHSRAAVNFFPAPIVDVEIYSLGLSRSGKSADWGLNRCSYGVDGRNLTCTTPAGFAIENVKSVFIHQEFARSDASLPGIQWFALTPENTGVLDKHCPVERCKSMLLPEVLRSRLPGEDFEKIDYERFSLIKQEILRRIRFFVRRNNDRVYSSEIQF